MAHQVGGRRTVPHFAGALRFLATQLNQPIEVVQFVSQGVSAEPTLQSHELLVRVLIPDLNVLAGREQHHNSGSPSLEECLYVPVTYKPNDDVLRM